MVSKYAKAVRKLLRKVYPIPRRIIKEFPLGDIAKSIILSKSTEDLIVKYDARINRMRIDFYIKGQVAIEVHGEQHEKEVRFSNEILDTKLELQRRIGLDRIKQEIIKASGIPYLCIWYYEIKDLTPKILKEKICAAQAVADKISPRYAPNKTKGKVSGLGLVRITEQAKLPTRLGGKKLENFNRPFINPGKGKSKLSNNWKQYKRMGKEK